MRNNEDAEVIRGEMVGIAKDVKGQLVKLGRSIAASNQPGKEKSVEAIAHQIGLQTEAINANKDVGDKS